MLLQNDIIGGVNDKKREREKNWKKKKLLILLDFVFLVRRLPGKGESLTKVQYRWARAFRQGGLRNLVLISVKQRELGDTAVELTLRTDVCSSNPAFFSGSVISGVGRVKSSGTKWFFGERQEAKASLSSSSKRSKGGGDEFDDSSSEKLTHSYDHICVLTLSFNLRLRLVRFCGFPKVEKNCS